MPAQQPSPTYIHSLTTAFASTLDEIPQDMCRHFADLRELDAVLSQSLSSITTRIEHLTERIEGGLVSLNTQDEATTTEPAENTDSAPPTRTVKEEEVISMFQMLHEIADETSRIKLGGEDKIRVASLAAEHMNAYYVHLLAITRRMCDIDDAYAPEVLQPYTMYPHVPPSALVDPAPENRRGQPKRGVAALNPRNDSINRMNGGDTPNKRRRPQGAQPYPQTRDVDTDDSTPRRKHPESDADAYRPGGNTASKARTQNRKPRETRVQNQMDSAMATDPMDIPRPGSGIPGGHSMQGVEPTHSMKNHVSASSHKPQGHSGRGRTEVSSQYHPNANPQPQPYPMPYGYGSNRNVRMPYEGQPGAPYDPMGPSTYPPNANPMMDVYNHHGGMNMNPNLNQMPHSNHSHMNLPLPTTLPPPPSGRTSSANIGSRAPYESPGSGVIPGSRYAMQNGSLEPLAGPNSYQHSSTKSSHRVSEAPNKERDPPSSAPPVSSGLMPVPMLTSLPPVTALNQSTALSMPPIPSTAAHEPGHSRPRGYSHSTYTSGYGPVEGSSGVPVYSHNQSGYQSNPNLQSSGPPPTNFTATGGSSGLERRTTSRTEAHPSLSSSSGPSKELPPLNTHIRDYPTGGSSAGGSASAMHASLARDPPFRTGSAGSGDRPDREPKSASMSSRPRSGTVAGDSSKIPSVERVAARQAGSPTYPVEHGDIDRDNTSGGGSRYSAPRYDGHWKGGKEGPSMHVASQSQSGRLKDEPNERFEERDRTSMSNIGATKRPNIDRLLDSGDNRAPERHEYSRTSSGGKVGDGGPMELPEDRPIKVPVRRKPVDDEGNRTFGEPASSDARDQDDDKLYCVCGQPSFGEMIACDDSECEYEWFHLQCLGITGAPPRGDYVCPWCEKKRPKGNKKPLKKKGTTGNGKGRNL